jgi:Uma2 family endonuclease
MRFEEFERMPEQAGKQELLRAELIELPPADPNHSEIALESCVRPEGPPPGRLQVGRFQLCAARGQPFTRGPRSQGAPAIAIEIIGPHYSAESLAAKTQRYFEFGSREVWEAYPKRRRVIVWVNGNARAIAADQAVTTPLIPGFALNVNEILPRS